MPRGEDVTLFRYSEYVHAPARLETANPGSDDVGVCQDLGLHWMDFVDEVIITLMNYIARILFLICLLTMEKLLFCRLGLTA